MQRWDGVEHAFKHVEDQLLQQSNAPIQGALDCVWKSFCAYLWVVVQEKTADEWVKGPNPGMTLATKWVREDVQAPRKAYWKQ
eukprot:7896074-Prorocentrum_lima.AAC.1